MTTTNASPGRVAYDMPYGVSVAPASATIPSDAIFDREILSRHARWFCQLRWLVVASMLLLAIVATAGGPWLRNAAIRLDPVWPSCVAAILAASNLCFSFLNKMSAANELTGKTAFGGLWLQILVDLSVLTAVVHFLGSVETSAPLLYLCHIVLACIFFVPAQSLAVTAVAMGMYLLCVGMETLGIIAQRSIWDLPNGRSDLPPVVAATYVGSVAIISAIIWYLTSRLAAALRERDAELTASNQRLLAANDERARHMLRTTHELKAPFAAIQVNTQLLLGGLCGKIPEAAVVVIRKMSDRCDLLSKEIRAMLQLANLRSVAQDPPKPTNIELDGVLRTCLANIEPQAAKRAITIEADLRPAVIQAAQDHVVMMIDNLLINAINYSLDGQRVKVVCHAKPTGGAILTVEDSGIGIPAEKLPRIFDDYYRTMEAVQHNKASTGLGLAIVRQAALAGNVHVHVESAPQQGTLFALDFPKQWGAHPELN